MRRFFYSLRPTSFISKRHEHSDRFDFDLDDTIDVTTAMVIRHLSYSLRVTQALLCELLFDKFRPHRRLVLKTQPNCFKKGRTMVECHANFVLFWSPGELPWVLVFAWACNFIQEESSGYISATDQCAAFRCNPTLASLCEPLCTIVGRFGRQPWSPNSLLARMFSVFSVSILNESSNNFGLKFRDKSEIRLAIRRSCQYDDLCRISSFSSEAYTMGHNRTNAIK